MGINTNWFNVELLITIFSLDCSHIATSLCKIFRQFFFFVTQEEYRSWARFSIHLHLMLLALALIDNYDLSDTILKVFLHSFPELIFVSN